MGDMLSFRNLLIRVKFFLFGSRKWFWLSVIAQFAMAGARLSNVAVHL
jgi:hypothetical protein